MTAASDPEDRRTLLIDHLNALLSKGLNQVAFYVRRYGDGRPGPVAVKMVDAEEAAHNAWTTLVESALTDPGFAECDEKALYVEWRRRALREYHAWVPSRPAKPTPPPGASTPPRLVHPALQWAEEHLDVTALLERDGLPSALPRQLTLLWWWSGRDAAWIAARLASAESGLPDPVTLTPAQVMHQIVVSYRHSPQACLGAALRCARLRGEAGPIIDIGELSHQQERLDELHAIDAWRDPFAPVRAEQTVALLVDWMAARPWPEEGGRAGGWPAADDRTLVARRSAAAISISARTMRGDSPWTSAPGFTEIGSRLSVPRSKDACQQRFAALRKANPWIGLISAGSR